MKPRECLAKDTNGEESKKKLEKEKVKVKRSSHNFKLQQCIMKFIQNQTKNILSILCPCPERNILCLSEHFHNFYTFLFFRVVHASEVFLCSFLYRAQVPKIKVMRAVNIFMEHSKDFFTWSSTTLLSSTKYTATVWNLMPSGT